MTSLSVGVIDNQSGSALRGIILRSILFVSESWDRPVSHVKKNRKRSTWGGKDALKEWERRRREWIGKLEQRKFITRRCFLAAWLSHRKKEGKREWRETRKEEKEKERADWCSREGSLAGAILDAIFDFARFNGPEKSDLTGYSIEQKARMRAHYYVLSNVILLLWDYCVSFGIVLVTACFSFVRLQHNCNIPDCATVCVSEIIIGRVCFILFIFFLSVPCSLRFSFLNFQLEHAICNWNLISGITDNRYLIYDIYNRCICAELRKGI